MAKALDKLETTMRATLDEQKLIDLLRVLEIQPSSIISKVMDLGFISDPAQGAAADPDPGAAAADPDPEPSNYMRLRAAGYSTVEARRYRASSPEKIQELISAADPDPAAAAAADSDPAPAAAVDPQKSTQEKTRNRGNKRNTTKK